MLRILIGCIAVALSASTFAQVITVKDVLNREVTFDAPAKRVVVGFYLEDYMAIGTEKAYDNVVGMSKYIWQARSNNWEMYKEYRPSLDAIPGIGKVSSNTFSIEKVISLKPDLVMFADWQFKALGQEVERLENAGIAVLVVDYNAQTLERHLKSTQLIGAITGQTERAAKIANEYQQNATMISKRLAAANLPKPKVYTEYGAQGTAEPGFTFGKNMWGAIATMAGGDNISAPFVEWWGTLNPEQILSSNPDIIFITGYESTSANDGMIMGQGVAEKDAKERLAGFTKRTGWSALSAVKNDRIFGAYHGAVRTILDGAMIQFYAKSMYPELFKDLKPEETYRAFYDKYLPVVPEGTFITKL